MKKFIFPISIVLAFLTSSCKKDYVCVCTEKATGAKSYGDTFKAGPLTKKAAEKSCESNNDVYSNTLEGCHLE